MLHPEDQGDPGRSRGVPHRPHRQSQHQGAEHLEDVPAPGGVLGVGVEQHPAQLHHQQHGRGMADQQLPRSAAGETHAATLPTPGRGAVGSDRMGRGSPATSAGWAVSGPRSGKPSAAARPRRPASRPSTGRRRAVARDSAGRPRRTCRNRRTGGAVHRPGQSADGVDLIYGRRPGRGEGRAGWLGGKVARRLHRHAAAHTASKGRPARPLLGALVPTVRDFGPDGGISQAGADVVPPCCARTRIIAALSRRPGGSIRPSSPDSAEQLQRFRTGRHQARAPW